LADERNAPAAKMPSMPRRNRPEIVVQAMVRRGVLAPQMGS
jgi:hypothetical protein